MIFTKEQCQKHLDLWLKSRRKGSNGAELHHRKQNSYKS